MNPIALKRKRASLPRNRTETTMIMRSSTATILLVAAVALSSSAVEAFVSPSVVASAATQSSSSSSSSALHALDPVTYYNQSIEQLKTIPKRYLLPSYDYSKTRYQGLGEFGMNRYCGR
mmetsp:Transcript_14868/g.30424  ORF Transcript_14868/g.30424 Transcript_14868/m.30424 type:complete len:119 (-) Transcript_14868:215-571(-)